MLKTIKNALINLDNNHLKDFSYVAVWFNCLKNLVNTDIPNFLDVCTC